MPETRGGVILGKLLWSASTFPRVVGLADVTMPQFFFIIFLFNLDQFSFILLPC